MKTTMTSLTVLLLSVLLLPGLSFAEKKKYPPRFQAVMDYLLKKEYPEQFADKSYRIRPTGFDIGDLDGDGVDEVVVSFFPHYRQSPTVAIFRVSNKMKVTRVKEGLAPGPLVPINGEYLDSHTMGQGLDMTLGKNQMTNPEARKDMVAVSMQNMGGVVAYKNFMHMDGRDGKGVYIDMQHINKPSKEKTCNSFQFSRVQHVRIGRKKGEKVATIIAVAGNKAYLYKINKIRADGLIDKTIKIVPLGSVKK